MNLKCNATLAKDLDPEQLKAVEAPIKNVCVFAVAGSGKTRVLTYRVANMIDNGIPEKEMMLLTFTEKASSEMTGRIKNLLHTQSLNLLSGTFHSVASKFLRKYSHEIGRTPGFTILGQSGQYSLMESFIDEYVENGHIPENLRDEFPSKSVLINIYSGAINHNMTFKEYIQEYYPYFLVGEKLNFVDIIYEIFEDYNIYKQQENTIDFDDILLFFLDILSNDKIKKEINNHFKYIFVDEYQDINWMQFEILEKLNTANTMFVIGDKAQCIYQFRGSKDEYIDLFESTHNDVSKYKLTYNYRSTPEILLLAEQSINRNDMLEGITLNTKNEPFSSPLIIYTDDEHEETRKIAKIIKDNYADCLTEVAILVRKGNQIALIEEALREENVPYNIVGAKSFYDNDYVKNLLAIVQLRVNRADEASFIKTIRLFPGIGQKYAKDVFSMYKLSGYNYNSVIGKFTTKVDRAIKFMKNVCEGDYKTVSDLIAYICNDFYENFMRGKYTDFEDKFDDIKYLMNSTRTVTNVSAFIDDITLDKVTDRRNKNQNYVTVITMHKAKGLEWDNVFLPFVDKGEFPRCREKDYLNNAKHVQNERNLFYVAITRAKKQIIISYSLKYDNRETGKSPFLEEFEEDCYVEQYLEKGV